MSEPRTVDEVVPRSAPEERAAALYLDLLKRTLTRSGSGETWRPLKPHRRTLHWVAATPTQRLLERFGFAVCRRIYVAPDQRVEEGGALPAGAETMVGVSRLDHLQDCIADVLARGVPGDLIETGVWRGGATIFMRGALEAFGDTERDVWVADSFRGMPKPTGKYSADAGTDFWTLTKMEVSADEVRDNFARYGLLDDRVRFLEGWFRDTLPDAPIEQLAVLRMDGVMYESTIDPLRYLYPKVAHGGYVIVDDYSVPACRKAVDDYRAEHGIADPIQHVDRRCVYWRKQGEP
jgi:O-methyltransferase